MFSEPTRRPRRFGPRTKIAAVVIALVAVAVVLFLLFSGGGEEKAAERPAGEGVSSQTVTGRGSVKFFHHCFRDDRPDNTSSRPSARAYCTGRVIVRPLLRPT